MQPLDGLSSLPGDLEGEEDGHPGIPSCVCLSVESLSFQVQAPKPYTVSPAEHPRWLPLMPRRGWSLAEQEERGDECLPLVLGQACS